MRFACGDMRDHIVSYQNDHRPSYWRRRALREQARLRIDFSEILRVVRFSTFATISANSGTSPGAREHARQAPSELAVVQIGTRSEHGNAYEPTPKPSTCGVVDIT